MKDSSKTIWTIGHSTHPFEEFISMLQSFQIEVVADVRSFPGSGKFPQYNKEILQPALLQYNIAYSHILKLGGRRKANPLSKNIAWRHAAFRSYADYMETNDFATGIKELEEMALQKRVAFMCSEAVWWRCHRSIIADYLKINGWKVMHIMAVNKAVEHPYTSAAHITNGQLDYTMAANK
ncbi:MAG: DUF488 domain-containing protein [Bacteroidetes bacterium]|nr:DUF488 domain-containing protein [Bacteroidota bacterium]MBS1758127.1 DUF488 domain-containing protein [Bacteroidota bacterium]